MSEFPVPKTQRTSRVSVTAVAVEPEDKKSGPPFGLVGTRLPHSTYVYVNRAYDGRLSSVHDVRSDVTVQMPPPTSVVREQYWACSRWPRAQQFLAATVGVLLGAIVGLAVMVVIRGSDKAGSIFEDFFKTSNAPD